MITHKQYQQALIDLKESQKVIDAYRDQESLSTKTMFSKTNLEGIEAFKQTSIDDRFTYISIQVNKEEVQRITHLADVQYYIQHSRTTGNFNTTLTNLYNWFKRRGFQGNKKSFIDKFKPYENV